MTVEIFNKTLKDLKLGKKEFAEMTGVNYTGVSAWHDDKRPIPSWVDSWLDNYKKAKAAKIAADTMREAGFFD